MNQCETECQSYTRFWFPGTNRGLRWYGSSFLQ